MKNIRYILICLILVFSFISCSNLEKQYEFPLKNEDIEKIILNKESDWKLENVNELEDFYSFTLKNSDSIIISIASIVHEVGNKLVMS